jgi:eukaryotic-like serine/threonine-protein kinase
MGKLDRQDTQRSRLNRQVLILGGLGSLGAVGAWLLKRLTSPLPPLQTFNFEVVTVNAQGQINNRKNGQAKYFMEDLGSGVMLEMVAISTGKFLRGSPANELQRDSNEGPRNIVTLRSFYMGRFQVTQAQWQAVMGNNPSFFKGENYPIETVSWDDAREFCKRLFWKTGRTYRLPSEAEWEYACRAGTTTPFHFGPTITPDLANYDGNYGYDNSPKGKYRQLTTAVGSFPANAFGLCDMHGNVWEWCEDEWHNHYQGAPTDGSAWTSGKDSTVKTLRGGSWGDNPGKCRSASRLRDSPGTWLMTQGFRVACSAPEV